MLDGEVLTFWYNILLKVNPGWTTTHLPLIRPMGLHNIYAGEQGVTRNEETWAKVLRQNVRLAKFRWGQRAKINELQTGIESEIVGKLK